MFVPAMAFAVAGFFMAEKGCLSFETGNDREIDLKGEQDEQSTSGDQRAGDEAAFAGGYAGSA